MKRIKPILLLIVLSLLLTACSPKSEVVEPNQTSSEESVSNLAQLPEKDPAGNPMVIPENIDKIVSLAPSITEILIEMGYGDKLIAVDLQSKNLEGLPEGLDFFDLMSPDGEKLTALKPDMIYASTIILGGGTDPLSPLKDFGISVAYIPSSDSIEGIYSDIAFIAATLRDKEAGEKIISEMKAVIDEIRSKGEKIKDKKTVYFEISAAPYMYSFGSGVFLNEMIELIGAENVLSDQESWISVSEEAILNKNPDVILTNVNYMENSVDEIKGRAGWEAINAVKENQVYYIDNMSSSLPNHNIIKALEEMLKSVYPENS